MVLTNLVVITSMIIVFSKESRLTSIEKNIESLNKFLTLYNEDVDKFRSFLTIMENMTRNLAKIDNLEDNLHKTQMVVESSNLGRLALQIVYFPGSTTFQTNRKIRTLTHFLKVATS